MSGSELQGKFIFLIIIGMFLISGIVLVNAKLHLPLEENQFRSDGNIGMSVTGLKVVETENTENYTYKYKIVKDKKKFDLEVEYCSIDETTITGSLEKNKCDKIDKKKCDDSITEIETTTNNGKCKKFKLKKIEKDDEYKFGDNSTYIKIVEGDVSFTITPEDKMCAFGMECSPEIIIKNNDVEPIEFSTEDILVEYNNPNVTVLGLYYDVEHQTPHYPQSCEMVEFRQYDSILDKHIVFEREVCSNDLRCENRFVNVIRCLVDPDLTFIDCFEQTVLEEVCEEYTDGYDTIVEEVNDESYFKLGAGESMTFKAKVQIPNDVIEMYKYNVSFFYDGEWHLIDPNVLPYGSSPALVSIPDGTNYTTQDLTVNYYSTEQGNYTNSTGGVSRWTLDINSGTQADSWGNNDGTVSSATYTSDGYLNGAYEFDGVDDKINVNYGSNEFWDRYTYSAWIKPNSKTNNQNLISSYDGSSLRSFVGIRDYGIIIWEYDESSAYYFSTSDNNLIQNDWNHILVKFDLGTYEVYVNGINQSGTYTGDVQYSYNIKSDWYLGGRKDSSNTFNGTIDEVEIYNRSLSAEEILNNYQLNKNLHDDMNESKAIINWEVDDDSIAISNMPFEGGSNSTFTKDYSSNANDAIVNGSTYNSTGGYDGYGAYEFINADDYILVGESSIYTPSDYTTSIWFNVDTIGSSYVIHSTGWGKRELRLIGDDLRYGIYNSSNAFVSTTYADSISADTWYNVMTSYNNETDVIKMYLNGDEVSSLSDVGGDYNIGTSQKLCLGYLCYGSSHYPFDGTLDEFVLYDRVLSPEQVYAIYNNGTDLIDSEETVTNEIWKACITINSGTNNGVETCSNNLTILSAPTPTINNVILNSSLGTNGTAENLTVWYDVEGVTDNPVKNITDWRIDDNSIALLNMPFETFTAKHNSVDSDTKALYYFENNPNDETGNNDGSVTGATYTSEGKVGGAYDFDGTNDYIAIDGSDNLTTYSISLWVKTADNTEYPSIFQDSNGDDYSENVYGSPSIALLNGRLILTGGYSVGDGYDLIMSGEQINNSGWHHVVGMINSTSNNMTLYLDGNLVGTKISAFTTSLNLIDGGSSARTEIGDRTCKTAGGLDIDGTIDEVQIYDRFLTGAEISELHSDGLDSDTDVFDYSSFENMGVVDSATYNPTGGYDGWGAYEFDGVDDSVEVDMSLPSSEISISFWASVEEVKTQSVFIATPDDTSDRVNFHLCYSNGNTYWDFGNLSNGGRLSDTNPSTCSNNDWHYYVLTASESKDNMEIYIDGELWINKTGMDSLDDITQTLRIGGDFNFNGSLDQVQIFNRSLSAEQISAMYNNQTDLIVLQETEIEDVWKACITPNDGINDGTEVCSNNLTILSAPTPTINNVILNSSLGTNGTAENLTVWYDVEGVTDNPVKNITDWRIDDNSIALLNMPFEAGSSNSTFTKDYSTFENNGTVNGSTFNPTGGYDGFGAYEFDGVNDYIEVGDDSSLDAELVTMSLWFKENSHDDYAYLAGKFNTIAGGQTAYGIRYDNADRLMGYITLDSGGVKTFTSTSTWADDSWHNAVLTYNGTDAILYVDGVNQANYTGSSDILEDLNGNFTIGKDLNVASRLFNGTIDEVQIFNRSLSAEQISAMYNNQTDLIVSQETEIEDVWKACITPNDGINDGTEVCSDNLTVLADNNVPINISYGLNANVDEYNTSSMFYTNFTIDQGGKAMLDTLFSFDGTNYSDYDSRLILMLGLNNNSNIGETPTNIVDVSLEDKTCIGYNIDDKLTTDGKYGGAVNFTGDSSDYIMCEDMNITGYRITMEAWVKPNSLPNIGGSWMGIMGKLDDHSGDEGYGLMITSHNPQRWGVKMNNRKIYSTSTYPATAGEWTHLMMTKDTNIMYLYVNGNFAGATSCNGQTINESDANFTIGKTLSEYDAFDGVIDEVRVYDEYIYSAEFIHHVDSNLNKVDSTNWTYQINKTITGASGSYDYYACANTSTETVCSDSRTVNKDDTDPVITIVSPESRTYRITTIDFNVSTNEATDLCVVSIDGASAIPMTQFNSTYHNYTGTGLSEGAHNAIFYCNDTFGNVGASPYVYFGVDSYPPTIDLNYPTNFMYTDNGTDLQFNYTPSPNGGTMDTCKLYGNWSGSWDVIDTDISPENGTINTFTETISSDGTYKYNVWCNESTGNDDFSAMGNFTFTIDTVNPTINITYPINGSTYLDYVIQMNYTYVESNPYNCWYSTDDYVTNVSTTCSDGSINGLLNDLGESTWAVCINDSAGRQTCDTTTFNVSIPPMEIIIVSPNKAVYNTQTIDFNITTTEDAHTCVYSFDNFATNNSMSNTSLMNFYNTSTLSEGDHTVNYWCNNTVGASSAPSSYSFEIDLSNVELIVNYPLESSYENVTTFNVSAVSNILDSCWYDVGAGNVSTTCNTEITGLTANDGSNTWYYCANNTLGNITCVSAPFSIDAPFGTDILQDWFSIDRDEVVAWIDSTGSIFSRALVFRENTSIIMDIGTDYLTFKTDGNGYNFSNIAILNSSGVIVDGNVSADCISINGTMICDWDEVNGTSIWTNVSGVATYDGNVNVTGNISVGDGVLFVDSDTGMVGIGTDEPLEVFDVVGDSIFEGNVTIADAFLGVGSATPTGSFPEGWDSGVFVEIDDATYGNDAGMSVRASAYEGLDIWADDSEDDSFIDNICDSDTCDIHIRTRTSGTPINAMTIEGSGDVNISGNLTIGDKITFAFEEFIDNLVDGWLRINGKLNVTDDVVIGGDLNVTGKISNSLSHMHGLSTEVGIVGTIGTWYNITFNSSLGDLENLEFEDNRTVIIDHDGHYTISFGMGFKDASPSPNAHVGQRIVVNGIEVVGSYIEQDTSKQNADIWSEHATHVYLQAGDKLNMQYIASDTDVTIEQDDTYATQGFSAYGYLQEVII